MNILILILFGFYAYCYSSDKKAESVAFVALNDKVSQDSKNNAENSKRNGQIFFSYRFTYYKNCCFPLCTRCELDISGQTWIDRNITFKELKEHFAKLLKYNASGLDFQFRKYKHPYWPMNPWELTKDYSDDYMLDLSDFLDVHIIDNN